MTAEDITAYVTSVRDEIDRHGGDLSTAVGIVVGAASSCWTNLAGAGTFESDRASALVDLLLSYRGAFEQSAAAEPRT